MVYSIDLIKKSLNYIENGASLSQISQVFGVTTRTLSNWLQRQKQQDLAPKMHGSSPSKIDNEKLKKYVEDHPFNQDNINIYVLVLTKFRITII